MGDSTFPITGRSSADLLAELAEMRPRDIDWRHGKAFSLVYNVDDPDLEALQHEIAGSFLHENALNPFRYKTLLRMEGEVLDMACSLFGAAAGSMSSGGTESIFLAVQTARDHARARGVVGPKLLVVPAVAEPLEVSTSA